MSEMNIYDPYISRRGEMHFGHKLDWKKVNEIRDSFLNKEKKQKELAEIYNVSIVTISYVVNNKMWYDENYQKKLYEIHNRILLKLQRKTCHPLTLEEVDDIKYLPKLEVDDKTEIFLSVNASKKDEEYNITENLAITKEDLIEILKRIGYGKIGWERYNVV